MIYDILEDINLAKNNTAYISALSLALTIPDLCGQLQYGKKRGGAHYIEWFDKWVYKYCKLPDAGNNLLNSGSKSTNFDGKNCYALRCALLHAGNTDLKANHGEIDCFELCVSTISNHCGDSYVCDISNDCISNIYVSLNVVGLIDALIEGAKEYISNHKAKSAKLEDNLDCTKIFGSIRIRKEEE